MSALLADVSTSNGNLLIVDDMPDNLRLLSGMLTQQGYEVRSAISGTAALMAVDAMHPDLILLDINMPQMNGYELCQTLKMDAETREIPIIFLSALSDVIDKVKAFQVGGVDYITKPFQIEEMVARIESQLSLRRMQLALRDKNDQLKQEIDERQQVEAALRKSEYQLKQQTIQLQETLTHLQQAQAQLVQSEKMSSLGQLVAGVAHEINNPINFIHGNLAPARTYTEGLLKLVALYQDHVEDVPTAIAHQVDLIDLEFVQQDLPRLLASMQVGTDRIREIVRSLRNFSRLDEAEKKAVDLHEGLESTLLILSDRFKHPAHSSSIQLIKDYGDLPLIECYPGPLNQVFMNILVNALDAVEESLMQGKAATIGKNSGWIRVRTDVTEDDHVRITISDNGCGMTKTVQQRLFDPFFTTKPIGKGTGMGMAISYQIITERHQGRLICSSDLNQGTEFMIEIPLQQDAKKAIA